MDSNAAGAYSDSKPAGPDGRGFLPSRTYDQIRGSVPIACVDLLPWRQGGGPSGGREILLIERLDRDDQRGLTLIGGRIRIDEPIAVAAERHLHETVGGEVGWRAPDWSRPERVAEYVRGRAGNPTFDPAQNSIALTYFVEVGGAPVHPGGEALSLHWFPLEQPPAIKRFGFGQGPLVHDLVEELGRMRGGNRQPAG
jgi:ADP-ribose pyrophosphatase YjhB (NUDIX family)